jgi:hypothetical protein
MSRPRLVESDHGVLGRPYQALGESARTISCSDRFNRTFRLSGLSHFRFCHPGEVVPTRFVVGFEQPPTIMISAS